MTNLLTFILACYGRTMIAVYGKIFENFRNKIHSFDISSISHLIRCCLCSGFWIGIFVNILMYSINKSLFNDIIVGSFLSGCISSGTSYFLSKLADDDGLLVKVKRNK
jgi:hypothetical protein